MRALVLLSIVYGWILSVVLRYVVDHFHHHGNGYPAGFMGLIALCVPLVVTVFALFAVDLIKLGDTLFASGGLRGDTRG